MQHPNRIITRATRSKLVLCRSLNGCVTDQPTDGRSLLKMYFALHSDVDQKLLCKLTYPSVSSFIIESPRQCCISQEDGSVRCRRDYYKDPCNLCTCQNERGDCSDNPCSLTFENWVHHDGEADQLWLMTTIRLPVVFRIIPFHLQKKRTALPNLSNWFKTYILLV